MPRTQTYTKRIEFNEGSLMSGRTVKTASYSSKLVKVISESNCFVKDSDVRGWCGLSYIIQSVDNKNKTVLLKYSIPNTSQQYTTVMWPMSGLSKSFGIRI